MSSSSLAHASSPPPTHAPAPSRAIDDAVSGQELRTPQRNVPESSRPNNPSNDHKSMAAVPSTAHVAPAPKTGRLDINALISPPVGVYDNFSSSAAPGALPMMQADVKLPASSRQDVPPSPPISNQSTSPLEQAKHNISPTPSLSVPVKDPILFPNPDASSSPSRIAPLFGTAEQDNEKIINEHIRRAASVLDERQQPTKDEYDLVLLFRSGFMKQFQRDQIGWLNQEKALLAVDRAAWHRARHPPAHNARPVARPQNMVRAQAPKPQHIRSSTTRVQKPTKGKEPRITKPQPAPRPIRTSPGTARGTTRVSSTPEPRTRTVAPNREDKDFNSIPNYTPPLESLGNKALKVDWKGNPLDLSRDPYAYLLHPEELKLAASLRLDCATYLTSKRRIFEARRNCAMRTPPKPFRKTDAQQACKIDVNKASKLWTAYDSVGWLDERWVFPSR